MKRSLKKQYDFIIVGGGPAGIMTAYKLNQENPNKTILLLEKNNMELKDYREKNHDNIFNWSQAQFDPDFNYRFLSEDGISLWMGKGLGGGTLHFGLQYIDTEDVINKNYQEWKNNDGENIIDSVNTITGAQKYNYTTEAPSSAYDELKTSIDNNNQADWYNNKIYSKDTSESDRLLLGELIENNNKITIKYGITIKKVNFVEKSNKKQIKSVEDFNEVKYYGNRVILCAGAIQTPAILQRSLIETEIQDGNITSKCGNKLYDHAGFSLIYAKKQQPQLKFTLNTTNIGKLNTHSGRVIRIASDSRIGEDRYKVYDFYKWAYGNNNEKHPGGRVSTLSTGGTNYNLNMRSSHNKSNHWNDTRAINGRVYLGGKKDEDINYDDLPDNIKSESLKNDLFTQAQQEPQGPIDLGFNPDEIIPHIQTRDSDLNWQVYYSTVPSNSFFGQDANKFIILTFAQSTNLNSSGKVLIKDLDSDENPLVRLDHYGSENEPEPEPAENEYINDMLDAFIINNNIMKNNGFELYNFPEQQFIPSDLFVTKEYIKNNKESIYHYHGTCQDIVDDTQKVNNTNNLFIGDISVLNKPWGGSTSFPALVTGYLVAKNISKEINNGDINGDKKIGIEDLNLLLKNWAPSNISTLDNIKNNWGNVV
tara:strand:+ start:3416 stop:5362 length:1947 start_codon:yes stop_codon:yes gene_type:complete